MLLRSRALLATVCVLLVASVIAAPANAAKPKKWRHVQTCAYHHHPEYESTPALNILVHSGRWYDSMGGNPVRCYDEMNDDFRPSIRGSFRLTARWYVGKKVVLKERRKVKNDGWDSNNHLRFEHPRLTEGPDNVWSIGKRRVTAKLTFTKKGYRTVRVRVKEFHFPPE
jgi:hypothetical protein